MNNSQLTQKLSELWERANTYVESDPNASILKIGIFGEVLTVIIAQEKGIDLSIEFEQHRRLMRLWESSVITAETASYFHKIRQSRNQAIHVDIYGDFATDFKIAQKAIRNAEHLRRLYPEFIEQSREQSKKTEVRQAKTPPSVQDKYKKERITSPDYPRKDVRKTQTSPTKAVQTKGFTYTSKEHLQAIEFLEKLKKRDDSYFQQLHPREYIRVCELSDFFDSWKQGFDSELESAIEYLRFMGEENF